jgi:hypoxanthine phosphoribosyltransferase
MHIIRNRTIDVLFSEALIAERNLALAGEIAARNHKDLLVIAVLKGSFIFAADLVRAMHKVGLSPEVEFMMISSYGKGTSSGELRLTRDVDSDVAGRDILLIDDILESGKTLAFARDLLMGRGANSVSFAVLLDKSAGRNSPVSAEFTGFICPDHFVVGYGMDAAYAFRELPFVGVVTGTAGGEV